MIGKENRERFEELLQKWVDGTIGESDRRLLLGMVGSDPCVGSWLESKIGEESPEIDPDVSKRMLARIHDSLERSARDTAAQCRNVLRVKVQRAAAMIALPLAAAFATWSMMRPGEPEGPMEVIAERGEKATVVLPDGSKVWLNSSSRLTYSPEDWRRDRHVNIVGEAYFEVRHDARRPFTVAADKLNIKVLGTRFNIKAYPDDALSSSTLVEGSVEVTTPNGRYALEPGWQLGYDSDRNVTRSPERVDTADCIAWIDNKLVFDDQPFEQIIASVERMYNIKMVFTSESIRSRRFSGTLPNTGLKEFLEVISISSPVSYRVENGTVYLSEDSKRIELFR